MRDHNEFEFEFEIVATVGVRAQSENHALEVVCSVLGAPSTQEIALANAGNFVLGRDASVVAVDFITDTNSVKLIAARLCNEFIGNSSASSRRTKPVVVKNVKRRAPARHYSQSREGGQSSTTLKDD
jgi:hypothetical protein